MKTNDNFCWLADQKYSIGCLGNFLSHPPVLPKIQNKLIETNSNKKKEKKRKAYSFPRKNLGNQKYLFSEDSICFKDSCFV